MKVLQLVTKRQYRGAEVFAATLSAELLKLEVEILFVGIYPPPEDSLEVLGAVNRDLNGDKKFISVSLVKKLSRLLKKESPDIIQANGSDTLKYAVLARIVSGKRIPIIYRNISILSAWVGKSFLKGRFYKYLFSKVDFVTSVGHESINDLVRFFDYPKDQTCVIRRGIPITPVDKKESRTQILNLLKINGGDEKLVVHAGNYSTEKNHEFLVDVFTRIKGKNATVKLLLIGAGDRYDMITDLIQKAELHDTVYQLGFRKDINLFLSAADLFVLCSKIEGVPGVILEAAAQNTPSLAIRVGGVDEVISNGKTGVILNGYDVDEFATKLLELVSDSARLNELGTNALLHVVENFNPTKSGLTFLDLYRKLATTKNKH
jgi:glycosyltransferase involved in cell wall biosynthesis